MSASTRSACRASFAVLLLAPACAAGQYYYPEPPPAPDPTQASFSVVNLLAADTASSEFVLSANGVSYARGLPYGAVSAPYSIAAGSCRFDAAAGSGATASWTTTLAPDTDVLLVAHGGASGAALLAVPAIVGAGTSLRLVHAAQDAAAAGGIALVRDDGAPIAGLAANALAASGAVTLAPGSLDLKLVDASGTRVLLDLAPFSLAAGEATTLVVGGDAAAPQGLVVSSATTRAPLATEAIVDLTYDGAYFEPATPGQGFVFAVVPPSDRLTGAWFTWGTQAGQHDWLLLDSGPGAFDGRVAVMQMFRASGGRLADPAAAVAIAPVGTIRVEFAGCDGARLSIDRTDVAFRREMSVTRLTPRASCSVAP